MGAIMYYHEYEPDTMAPFLRGLITRFLNRTGTPLQSSRSYSFFPSVPSTDNLLAPSNSSMPETDQVMRGSPRISRPPGSPVGGSNPQKENNMRSESTKSPESLTVEAFQGL